MYDYAAGKADWLAADQPFEGTAKLTGKFTRGVGRPEVEELRSKVARLEAEIAGRNPASR